MTYRWVVSHIQHLPEDSRWVKHLRRENDVIWDQDDHHRQDVVDLLQLVVYYLQTGPLSGLKDSQRTVVRRNAPKRSVRPGEKTEKPQMTSKEGLKEFFGISE